ncbi:MAG: FAD:protein FMN transferase [Clostridia bacterium]|jgi:thiamine biosynthesis lipoprotein|nr:FAD:protein FMN transferase [Clostridia bacterium]
MKKKLRLTFLIIMPFTALFLYAGCVFLQPREFTGEEFLMDTLVSISAYGADTDLLRSATNEAFAEMRRIEDLTDRFDAKKNPADPSSEVNRINEMAGIAPVPVGEDVFTMLQAAKAYFTLTKGAFDVTIGPVMDLWGFGRESYHVPTEEELREALTLVDSDQLILDREKQTAYLAQPGMSLDLGAIAKGYAVERAAAVLRERGIERALINAGGNIRVLGERAQNTPWRIGVQDPRAPSELAGIVELTAEAATTSGDYNRVFTLDGKNYHHLISSLTGYPAEDNISVTVITPDAFQGDLLSTALFLLDSSEALRLAEELEDTEVFLITSGMNILYSSGLKEKIEVKTNGRYSL